MTDLGPDDFAAFHAEVRGIPPLPWQEALLRRVAARGWPEAIDVPPELGRMSVVEVAVFAAALRAPAARRRVFLVSDRRSAASGVYDHARHLVRALHEADPSSVAGRAASALRRDDDVALAAARMSGGLLWSWRWLERPDRHAVVMATVDRLGSRLFVRGHGVGPHVRAIDAALTGTDSLLLIDGAPSFVGSARAAVALDATPEHVRPIVVALPDAPVTGDAHRRTAADEREPAAARRLHAARTLTLVAVEAPPDEGAAMANALAGWARHLARDARVVGVVCNTLARARRTFAALREDAPATLLTGRTRPHDTDHPHDPPRPHGDRPDDRRGPMFVVGTQAIEFGSGVEVDALVTEAAPLPALARRLALLAPRDGTAQAVMLRGTSDPADVYGPARDTTWHHLTNRAAAPPSAPDAPAPRMAAPRAQEPHATAHAATSLEDAAPDDSAPHHTPTHDAASAVAARHHTALQHEVAPPSTATHNATQGDTAPGDTAPGDTAPDDAALRDATAGEAALRDAAPDDAALHDAALRVATPGEMAPGEAAAGEAGPGGVAGVATERGPGDFDVARRAQVSRGGAGLGTDLDATARPSRGMVAARVADDLGGPPGVIAGRLDVSLGALGGLAEALHDEPGAYVPVVDGHVLDAWARSSPGADPDVPVEPFLHGVGGGSRQVTVVWRDGLDLADGPAAAAALAALPPTAGEAVELPLGAVRRWLAGDPRAGDISDLEGERVPVEPVDSDVRVLRHRGDGGAVVRAGEIRAGDLIVVPAEFGGCDAWGWDPASTVPVRDLSALTERPPPVGGLPITLAYHQADVGWRARETAAGLDLPADLVRAARVAGELHDEGKRDPRFQVMLHRGDRTAAETAAEPLGKSGMDPAYGGEASLRVREESGYPLRMRHEAQSERLVRRRLAGRGDIDADLALHLIAAHHGRGRPLLPPVTDPDPQVIDDLSTAETVDWASPARFARLQRRYGRWGLARLEAIVRMADGWCSAREGRLTAEEITMTSPTGRPASRDREAPAHRAPRTSHAPAAPTVSRMGELELDGLDGRTARGFLAALGLVRLLGARAEVRLSFSRSTGRAVLGGPYGSIGEVAAALNGLVRRNPRGAIPGVHPSLPPGGDDPLRVPRGEFRALYERVAAIDEGFARDWLPCLVTDLAVDSEGRVAATPHLPAPEDVRGFFERPLAAVRDHPERIREALAGTKGRRARRAGDQGTAWLATMALPWLRLTGDGERPAATLHRRIGGRGLMVWPLWRPALDPYAVRCLLEHPALALAGDEAAPGVVDRDWGPLGVFAAYAAEPGGEAPAGRLPTLG